MSTPPRRRTPGRRPARPLIAVAVVAGSLAAAATAHGEISGTVVAPTGVPVSSAEVELRDSAGATRRTSTDSSGAFSFSDFTVSRLAAPPFTISASESDRCRPFSDPDRTVTGTSVPVGDPAAGLVLDVPVRAFCQANAPSGSPEATAFVDPTTGEVLSRPGGIAYLDVTVPRAAESVTVALPDGTPLGSTDDVGFGGADVQIRTPNRPYNGDMVVSYSLGGQVEQAPLGRLLSAPPRRPVAAPGNFDLAAIVDVSGSMSSNDPENRRLDAAHLLIELSSPGDRLLAEGFDNERQPIFRRVAVNNRNRASLRRAARRGIKNLGGTNYNVAFENAFRELTAHPLGPKRAKGAIFLTDGGHNSGAYDNGHLRFALNGTGNAWPVCVVQLGRSFNREDVIRLRRIARDTGGTYLRAPNNVQLESLYFQCRGQSAGARTLVRRANVFRIGQSRQFPSIVRRGQARATFFTSWTDGRYRIRLFQPGRRAPYVRTTGKRVRLVKGRTFQYFQVINPRPGRWRMVVTRLGTGERTERAITTINVQQRRRR